VRERGGALTESRRITPRFNDVTTRHVGTAFECAGESVFVERSTPARWFKLALGREALAIITPGRNSLVAIPPQLLAALLMMPSPQRSIAFIETDHVLDTLKRTPRRPRRLLGQLMS
jgi:hypothetical protein